MQQLGMKSFKCRRCSKIHSSSIEAIKCHPIDIVDSHDGDFKIGDVVYVENLSMPGNIVNSDWMYTRVSEGAFEFFQFFVITSMRTSYEHGKKKDTVYYLHTGAVRPGHIKIVKPFSNLKMCVPDYVNWAVVEYCNAMKGRQ